MFLSQYYNYAFENKHFVSFFSDIIPQKIKAKEFFEMMAQNEEEDET